MNTKIPSGRVIKHARNLRVRTRQTLHQLILKHSTVVTADGRSKALLWPWMGGMKHSDDCGWEEWSTVMTMDGRSDAQSWIRMGGVTHSDDYGWEEWSTVIYIWLRLGGVKRSYDYGWEQWRTVMTTDRRSNRLHRSSAPCSGII